MLHSYKSHSHGNEINDILVDVTHIEAKRCVNDVQSLNSPCRRSNDYISFLENLHVVAHLPMPRNLKENKLWHLYGNAKTCITDEKSPVCALDNHPCAYSQKRERDISDQKWFVLFI